jgi:hypothetical protein
VGEINLSLLCNNVLNGKDHESTIKNDIHQWVSGKLLGDLGHSLLSARSPDEWPDRILMSSAAQHPWYPYLESNAELSELSSFLEEESKMPSFVPLLRKVESVMLNDSGLEAVRDNINDELFPESHSSLFNYMINQVTEKCAPTPYLDKVLAETNLTYYYGYFFDPCFLIGALYATELMVPRRANHIKKCMERHGFTGKALTFMEIHSAVDEKHSTDWLYRVIIPLVQNRPEVKNHIAEGIVVRLLTSKKHFSQPFLQRRKRESHE